MNNLEPFDFDRAIKSAAGCFTVIVALFGIACVALGAFAMEWLK